MATFQISPPPALQLPQAPDILGQFGRYQALRSMIQQQQLQQTELQQRQYEMGQTQAINQAYQSAGSVDPNTGMWQLDQDKLMQALTQPRPGAPGGYGSAAPSIIDAMTKYQQGLADLTKTKAANDLAERNAVGQLAYAAHQANDDPRLLMLGLQGAAAMYPTARQAMAALQQNPQLASPMIQHLMGNSPDIQKQLTEQTTAQSKQSEAATAQQRLGLETPGITAEGQIKGAEAQAMQQYGGLTTQAADAKYRFLQQQAALGQPINANDQAFIGAYEKTKLLAPQFRVDNRQGPQGTWSLVEDQKGNPLLLNSATGETRAAPNIQKTGTYQKTVAGPQAAINYASDYVNGGNFTGAGDEALLEQFFELAKPSSGFRMSQPQIDLLKSAQSWMNSADAAKLHATTGTWFSPTLRTQIVQTMTALGKAKGLSGNGGGGGAVGGHVIQIGDKQYQYKGSGSTADLNNYTEVAGAHQ